MGTTDTPATHGIPIGAVSFAIDLEGLQVTIDLCDAEHRVLGRYGARMPDGTPEWEAQAMVRGTTETLRGVLGLTPLIETRPGRWFLVELEGDGGMVYAHADDLEPADPTET